MSKRYDFVGFVGYRKQREPSFVQPAPFTSSWNPLFSVLIVFCVIFSGAAMLFSPFDDEMENTYQVEFLKTMVLAHPYILSQLKETGMVLELTLILVLNQCVRKVV